MTQKSHFGVFTKEIQNINLKRNIHLYVRCSIIYNSQDVEAAQVPINTWVDEEDVVHIYDRKLLSIKKE